MDTGLTDGEKSGMTRVVRCTRCHKVQGDPTDAMFARDKVLRENSKTSQQIRKGGKEMQDNFYDIRIIKQA